MVVADFKLTCIDPIFYRVDDNGRPTIMYPCGKCIVCKEKKRRQWAVRMENEKSYSKSVYFVTLTYADEFLYYKYPDCPASLNKVHYQSFLKMLRRSLDCKIRIFGVGEYGFESSRPHYHFMIFLPVYVRRHDFYNKVLSAWKYGFVTVKYGTSSRMYYIAKYTVKGSECPYGTEKPFQTCSQSPPIGYMAFENNKRMLYSDFSVNYISCPSGRKSSIPRSFENRFKSELDSIPSPDFRRLSKIRKDILQKRGSAFLRNYLKNFNEIPASEFLEMRNAVIRRYNAKHKHKLNQV